MKKVIIALLVIGVAFVGYKLATFELFDDKPTELESINLPGESYDLVLYLIPSNATVQGGIQIRKIHDDGVQETVANYPRYNHLISFDLLSDELELIIEDTIREKVDTVLYSLQ